MMSERRDIGGSRDLISGLPDSIIGHILSFLPTKEAASTSLLSTKWRYLFALVSNLDFDESVYLNPREEGNTNVSASFMDFVDRVLALQGNSPIHKFSLKMEDGREPADTVRIFTWILNVLRRGVLDLDLHLDLITECFFPSEIFTSKTLVKLKLNNGFGPNIDVEDVDLPKLKSLCLDSAHLEKSNVGLTKLLSGCYVLEDLILDDISTCIWDFCSISSTSVKRLAFGWGGRDENSESVSFDTPNLVYLEVFDTVADKYPKVNFGTLVEAKIDLRLTNDQKLSVRFKGKTGYYLDMISESDEEADVIAKAATDFMMGLCNVKILYLSADTLEILNYCCCDTMPIFNNLSRLTIESCRKVGWKSLPRLLKNSPNLETLILQGLVHKVTDRCGDVCLCKPSEDEEKTLTCLSSSPVKVLKIMKFGVTYHKDDFERQVDLIKHFVETMPNLEQMILYWDTRFDDDLSIQLTEFRMLEKVASPKCKIQVISDNISLSTTVHSSSTTNGPVFFKNRFPV